MSGLASFERTPAFAPLHGANSAPAARIGFGIGLGLGLGAAERPQGAIPHASENEVEYRSARYGADRRPDLRALAGAGIAVATLAATMLAMNVVGTAPHERPRVVVASLRAPEPPPPQRQAPPPPEAVAPRAQAPVPQVVAPPPPFVLTPAQPGMVTVAAPPPPVAVAAPPAPVAAAAGSAGPRIESGGDLSSTMISAAPPTYPLDSRRKHEQGTVVLAVLLDMEGRVADISISRSSGFDRLDRAALGAVRRWRWSPARRDGMAVMVRGLVEIPFILQS